MQCEGIKRSPKRDLWQSQPALYQQSKQAPSCFGSSLLIAKGTFRLTLKVAIGDQAKANDLTLGGNG
jgi:hypothetical protein